MKRLILAVAALLIATPLHAKWYEAETAHFIVKSRSSEKGAREVALELERFDMVLRQLQGMPLDHEEPSRANKLTLYRFGDDGDIARMAGYPGSGIAGFFHSSAGNSVAFVPIKDKDRRNIKSNFQSDKRVKLTPEVVLKHEYTHYFMMQHFPGAYPRWYVEGFAEIMGTARFLEDGSAHIGDPPQHRAYLIFRLSDFRLKDMLDENHELSGIDGIRHYATGWLLAHYLSFDFAGPRKGQMIEYLGALANGEDSLIAAERVFGDLRKLEKELGRYKKGPFPGLNVKLPTGTEPWVKSHRLSKAEEEFIQQEMRLSLAPSQDDARKIARNLEGTLEQFPQYGDGHALLAIAHLYAKDYSQADEVAERLNRVDETNTLGWVVRSLAAIELAKEDGADLESLAEQAREFATRAAGTNRHDPRPLIAYYNSYRVSNEAPPETAAIALEQAFQYAGTDTGYRLLLTRQLMLEDRMESALAVLLPVAFSGHRTGEPDDAEKPSLYRLLDLVRAAEREDAIAMIDKMMDDNDEEDA